MEGKKDNINGNGEKKSMIYEELNTENSSIPEELQNNSQFSNLELKAQVNLLFNKITQLTQDISELRSENSNIKKNNEIIPKLQADIEKIQEKNTMLNNKIFFLKKD